MNDSLLLEPTLAQGDVEVLRDMGRQFRAPEAGIQAMDVFLIVAFAASALLLITVLRWLLNRPDRRERLVSPRGVLKELFAAHRLSVAQRRLLTRIARHLALKEPARLFVDPDLLERCEWEAEFAKDAAMVNRLRRKLFPELCADEGHRTNLAVQ